MLKFICYFEALILGSIYYLYIAIRQVLERIGYNADWYSENEIHFWEYKKAHALYEKQYREAQERSYEEMQTLYKDLNKEE